MAYIQQDFDMLRKIRIVLAAACFAAITLLFLDVSGTLHVWLGWTAKIQLLPALLALNVGVVAALVVLTLLFGRLYCSIICPLGVMQDIVSWVSGRRKKMRYRFSHSPAKNLLRYGMLALFAAALAAGAGSAAALLAPYSAYGRIAQNLLAPLWAWGNNLLAAIAERADSYAFYGVDVWIRSGATFATAVATLAIVGTLAWRNGRTWCNTLCPVGTLLGFLSKYARFRPEIDTSKCNSCGLCSRACKAACIDGKAHAIDYSRCVACMDCIETCRHGAIGYVRRRGTSPQAAAPAETSAPQRDAAGSGRTPDAAPDMGRRSFLTGLGIFAATAAVKAQEKTVDGGLAVILDKKIPDRRTPILPPGAGSARRFASRCTGCQLCVATCPNGVLRPSERLTTLMQPEASYERGYCRPECGKCAEVCPTGAIRLADLAEKVSTQIGHAVWVGENCLPLTEGVSCGNCARHCPSGAILMVAADPADPASPKIPAVDTERCIGCGACEYLCPARPFSAIYVEGHERQRIL